MISNNDRFNLILKVSLALINKEVVRINYDNGHKRATVKLPMTAEEHSLNNARMLLVSCRKECEEILKNTSLRYVPFGGKMLEDITMQIKHIKDNKRKVAYPKAVFDARDALEIDILKFLVDNAKTDLKAEQLQKVATELANKYVNKIKEGSSD